MLFERCKPPGSQKPVYMVMMEALHQDLAFGMTCDDGGVLIRHQWSFFLLLSLFSLLPSKITVVIQNLRVVFLFIKMSTSIIFLLISNFCSWSFCKILICFNFIIQSQFVICYCFSIWSLIFNFVFGLFVKLIIIFNFNLQ